MAATSPVGYSAGVDANSRPGGGVQSLAVAVTTKTTAYAAANAMGGLLTFTPVTANPGGSAVIVKLVVTDTAKQDASLELWLFNQTFTTTADGSAFAVSGADLLNCVAVIGTGAYFDANATSVSVKSGFVLPVVPASQSLFGQLVSRGTPTYGAASLQVRLDFLPG